MRSRMPFELQTNSFVEVARVFHAAGKHKITESATKRSNRIPEE